ncbi:MAG: hypothetical protein EKK55_06930, partial [Rhodocyclaceae bacterium]
MKARVWEIADPKATIRRFTSGELKSVKDLSWELLNERAAIQAMERTEGGESAETNFGLAVFEHALDWSLGLAVFNHIRGAGPRARPYLVAHGSLPLHARRVHRRRGAAPRL